MKSKQRGESAVAFLLIICLLAICATGAVAGINTYITQYTASLSDHSLKHTTAITASQCFSNPENVESVWFNPCAQEYANVAKDDTGRYVEFRTLEGNPKTTFRISKTIKRIACWLNRNGYICMLPDL